MVRLPWAKGNLLIVFSLNGIIKELGPCVRTPPHAHMRVGNSEEEKGKK